MRKRISHLVEAGRSCIIENQFHIVGKWVPGRPGRGRIDTIIVDQTFAEIVDQTFAEESDGRYSRIPSLFELPGSPQHGRDKKLRRNWRDPPLQVIHPGYLSRPEGYAAAGHSFP